MQPLCVTVHPNLPGTRYVTEQYHPDIPQIMLISQKELRYSMWHRWDTVALAQERHPKAAIAVVFQSQPRQELPKYSVV